MIVLASTNLTALSFEVSAIFMTATGCVVVGVIIACGLSLIRLIDDSLNTSQAKTVEEKFREGKGDPQSRSERDLRLIRVRNKIERAVALVSILLFGGSFVNIFGVASSCGRVVPIIFFGIPMCALPVVWFEMCLLLHSPRVQQNTAAKGSIAWNTRMPTLCSHRSAKNVATGGPGGTTSTQLSTWCSFHGLSGKFYASGVIAPTETEECTGMPPLAGTGSLEGT